MNGRTRYVNGGLTEEGIELLRSAAKDGVCPLHRTALPARKRVWCGAGQQTPEGAITCYWAFHLRYGRIKDWNTIRAQVIDRDGRRCVACGAGQRRVEISGGWVWSSEPRLEVDHIVEIQDGGPEFDPANLRTLCRACHLAKTNARRRWGDSTLAERVLYERNHPEAHPRLEAFL